MNNAYQAQLALQVAFDCLLMFRHVAKKTRRQVINQRANDFARSKSVNKTQKSIYIKIPLY